MDHNNLRTLQLTFLKRIRLPKNHVGLIGIQPLTDFLSPSQLQPQQPAAPGAAPFTPTWVTLADPPSGELWEKSLHCLHEAGELHVAVS